MVYLVAIGSHTAGDDVQMIVVGVVVSIDQNRLVGVAIAHFIEVFVGYLQQLLMGIFVSSAGKWRGGTGVSGCDHYTDKCNR